MRISPLTLLFLAAPLLAIEDLTGNWVVQVSAPGEIEYARVSLQVAGASLTGRWNESKLEGTVTGNQVEFVIKLADGKPGATFKGQMEESGLSGAGMMSAQLASRPAGRSQAGSAAQTIAWKMTRAPQAPANPKTWDFEPKEFHGVYSAATPPALHIFPGDTVRSRTIDITGPDAKLPPAPGGNAVTGPFFIEGALPGDTLVVKLNKLRLNSETARGESRINGKAVTPAYAESAEYSSSFNSEWKLFPDLGYAMLAHPTERMKNYTVPLLPMLGCIATAPAASQSARAGDLGAFGGNMDYNQMNEGATLYLPVFHPGALLFFGDAHAAMGDGELNGSALETSLKVEFAVGLIKGYSTGNPRLENENYLMSVGVGGTVSDAIQIATSQLATWLKKDYRLNDNEVAVVLGTALKYDIAELVDTQFSIVAKMPKSALVAFK